jgi:hypothetical protein
MFYLVKFEEIKNWNVLLVFLPLLIIAISSEIMTRKKELRSDRVKPYSIFDFVLKILIYILSEVAFRKLLDEDMFFILFSLVLLLGIASFVCEVLMLKRLLDIEEDNNHKIIYKNT